MRSMHRMGRSVLTRGAVGALLALSTLFAPAALAADGTGTMTVTPTYLVSGSTGNGLSFNYTAAGAMTSGAISIRVPNTGWPKPTASGFDPSGVQNLCGGDTPVITDVGSPATAYLITISNITLSSGSSCQVNYGLPGFSGGFTAPVAAGVNTFTTQQKSTSGGALTNLGTSPQVTVGNDGTGTMTVNPTHVVVNTGGNELTFTYNATRAMTNGQLNLTVPAGWSAPSTTASAAGATTSTCGTVSVQGQKIVVTGITKAANTSCVIKYGDKTGGPGASTPTSTGGIQTFSVQHSATNNNNLIGIASSPKVSVTAADGTGTMAEAPNQFSTSSTGNELDFTFTAPVGGMDNGKLTILFPTNWPAPDLNGFNANGISNQCGGFGINPPTVTAVAGGNLLTIPDVTLAGGATCLVKYGINGFNSGVTAPSVPGNYTFTTSQSSSGTGIVTALASSPVVKVGDDGTGTMTVNPAKAVVNTTGNTEVFTYTAARAMNNGALTIAVPAGWSAPSTAASNAGATTSTCGSVSTSGQTITVSGVTLAVAGTCTVTYGSKASGPGASTPAATGGIQTFTTQHKAVAAGTLTPLVNGSPTVSVTATDGKGTMAEAPGQVITSSTGNELDFTFTSPVGGMDNGKLSILFPTNWPAPDLNGFNANGISNQCGGFGMNPPTVTAVAGGNLLTIPDVTLAGGATCLVKYGINGFNSGVTAPSVPGNYTFTTRQASTSTGALTALASSPLVIVGSDGTGTMTVNPAKTVVNSTGNQLTFTYTAQAPMTNGAITLAVPAGWTAPSTVASNAGATTSTCGSVGVAGQLITVSSVTLATNGTCTIRYGDKTSGPGATAPSSGGQQTFTAQQKSTAAGTLLTLGNGSPKVSVTAADGTGGFTVAPSLVLPSSSSQFTFTYTAPPGGLDDGTVTLTVPAGWTAPQTGNSSGAGWVNAACGTASVSVRTIVVSGLTLSGGNTCPITYGNTFAGGAGATAPAATGSYPFPAQQKATATGTLTDLAASPAVAVNQDGVGSVTASPLTASAGQSTQVDFTFTAAVAMSNGEVAITVPGSWSPPSTTATNPGYTTSSCGTVSVATNTLKVSGVTLAAGATCTISLGDTAGGGPGATASSTPGVSDFPTQERSSAAGTLADLPTSPKVTVYAADGSGTLTVAPTAVGSGATGVTETFTYTAPAGGMNAGAVTIDVPNAWSDPSTTGGTAGFTKADCGTVLVTGDTIRVANVSLNTGNTCKITYGDTSLGGPGATAPTPSGDSTFAAKQRSTQGGVLTALAASPVVSVLAADGTGTMTVAPSAVVTGSSGHELTFTYTAAAGGTEDGTITIDVPAGWSAPSTDPTAAGAATSGCGTVTVVGSTIRVAGVTRAGGATCSVRYGDKTSGAGASAPGAPTTSTFATAVRSSPAGTLTPVAASPAVTVSALPPKTLTVTVGGGGTVSGNGINCPPTCSAALAPGTAVTLTATPDSGFAFTAWGGACSGSAACSLTMDADKTVSATFDATGSGGLVTPTPTPTETATATPTASVTVTPTATATAPPGAAPACTLKGKSGKVKGSKPAVAVVATCDQAVSAALTGSVKTTRAGKSRKFALAAVKPALAARTAKTVKLRVPSAAAKALRKRKAKGTATVALAASNANGAAAKVSVKVKLRRG